MKQGKRTKGFLTKYALSAGIQEVVAELDGKYVWYPLPGSTLRMMAPIAYFHRTRAGAIAHQRELAIRAIARLKRQIMKLESFVNMPKFAKVKK